MLLFKDLLAQLILINEAIRRQTSLQTEQVREDRIWSRQCCESIQGSLQRLLAAETSRQKQAERSIWHNDLPEGRQASIQVQARSQTPKTKMEKIRTDLPIELAEGSRFPKIPLHRQHDMEYGSGSTRFLRMDELRS